MPPYSTRDVPRHYIVSLYFDGRDEPPPHHLIERAVRDELNRRINPKAKSILIVPATPSTLEPFLKKLANERNRKR